jgi:hypothetical protein
VNRLFCGRARLCWLAALALCAGAGSAGGQRRGDERSGTLRDEAQHYRIAVASGWRPIAAPPGTLVAYQAPGGRATLAISRIEIGLRWARDAAGLAADLERGVEQATRGFRRVGRQSSELGRVPVFDLSYRRAPGPGGDMILSRYLFFNRYSLVLSIGLGAGAGRSERRAAEAMVKSFVPYKVPR